MNDQHALCLCCGSEYDMTGDCPNVERKPHSIALALAVADYLREHGVGHPRPLDVHQARQAVEATGQL
jgi:hypothetical protein